MALHATIARALSAQADHIHAEGKRKADGASRLRATVGLLRREKIRGDFQRFASAATPPSFAYRFLLAAPSGAVPAAVHAEASAHSDLLLLNMTESPYRCSACDHYATRVSFSGRRME